MTWTVVFVVGTLVLLVGGYVVAHVASGEAIPRNTRVAGVAVGGMTRQPAMDALRAQLADRLNAITVTSTGASATFTANDLGLTVDWEASVDAAGAGLSWSPVVIWSKIVGGSDLPAVVNIDSAKATPRLTEFATRVDHPAANAGISYQGTSPLLTQATNAAKLDVNGTIAVLKRDFPARSSVVAAVSSIDADITTAEAQETLLLIAQPAASAPVQVSVGTGTLDLTPDMIASALRFEPKDSKLVPVVDPTALSNAASAGLKQLGLAVPSNASFTFVDGKPSIVPSVDGLGVAPDALANATLGVLTKTSASDRRVTVQATPQKAAFTTQDAENLGIKEVTGQFTTYYPDTAYRHNNIPKAAGLINGTLLKPGEIFSMNKTLGFRSIANGWMAGGAIDGGQLVSRVGGGISQATTTTFNAIFFAGLKDIYHQPHSLYFSRYPMGREATLDWDSIDMKFQNDSPYGVLLQAWTTGQNGTDGSVTVRVWSTKVYDVTATEPVQSNFRSPGPTQYDASDTCLPQSPISGFDVRYSRQFYKDGVLVKTEPFFWSYDTLTEVICTG